MHKVIITIAIITLAIFGLMFYQYDVQKNEAAQFKIYQNVLDEKSIEIYEQAKNWKKPVSIDTQDSRLKPDFQVMTDFMLDMMVQKVELRNSYLRALKEAGWDKFLDIHRLEKDKENNYIETEKMLDQVGKIIDIHQQKLDKYSGELQHKIKDLPIKSRFRRYLTEALIKKNDQDNDQVLFKLEKQSYVEAQKIFTILKSQQWKRKGNTFLFDKQETVNEFSQLYNMIIDLDLKMKQVSRSTKKELDQSL